MSGLGEARSGRHRFDLDGRVALVTGASAGLGERVARDLASAGARVAVLARRGDVVTRLAQEIGGFPIACDLLEPSQVDAVVPAIVDALGPPEILVNCAGAILTIVPAEDEDRETLATTLELNLVAPFRLAQDVFVHMRTLGRGSIVNVTSISGRVGVPGIPQASYAASKGGLGALTVELAVQWARHGVRVNNLAPGFFRSEMTDAFYETDRGASWLQKNTPLPIEGAPEDFVGAVLWLVSDAGRYVTGQTIVIDGGWTAK